jgi:putative phosphoesterase
MRIAVISDIHGNLEALTTALESIEGHKIDTIVCLGDLVGYGPYPNEVVEIIRSKKIMCILGNYDAAVLEGKFNYIRDNEVNKFCMPWAAKELSEKSKDYLKSLPRQIILQYEHKKICFVHGSSRSINEYLNEGSAEAEEVMEVFDGDILVCAHTHVPYETLYNDKLLLNDGSVGKPKIGRPNGTYLIMNIEKDTIETDIIEYTYDYEKTAKAMEEKCIHPSCINNIRTGIE